MQIQDAQIDGVLKKRASKARNTKRKTWSVPVQVHHPITQWHSVICANFHATNAPSLLLLLRSDYSIERFN